MPGGTYPSVRSVTMPHLTTTLTHPNPNLISVPSQLHACTTVQLAPSGLWGSKNWPAPFPGRMPYKVTKPGLVSVLYLSMRLLFIRAPFYVALVFVAVFCLLVVLVKLSVLTKWLARKTPLRKPNRGEEIVSRKPRPKNACDFLGLLYCFIVLLPPGCLPVLNVLSASVAKNQYFRPCRKNCALDRKNDSHLLE